MFCVNNFHADFFFLKKASKIKTENRTSIGVESERAPIATNVYRATFRKSIDMKSDPNDKL